MYQVAVKWKLWDPGNSPNLFPSAVTMRGYDEDKTKLPADLFSASLDRDGSFRGLSVESISSKYCPTRRDLYLEKKEHMRSAQTWGRKVGHLIEQFTVKMPDFIVRSEKRSRRTPMRSFEDRRLRSKKYVRAFQKKYAKKLSELDAIATTYHETPYFLLSYLEKNTQYELMLRDIDDYYAAPSQQGRLLQEIKLALDGDSLIIHPLKFLGLSNETKPDFIIGTKNVGIGEIKTGTRLQPFHLITLAGYAIAYESEHKVDVNYGIVYFVETHGPQLTLAQTYIIGIDDVLRRQFLDFRNKAYKVLQRNKRPRLANYKLHCQFCKFKSVCHPTKNP